MFMSFVFYLTILSRTSKKVLYSSCSGRHYCPGHWRLLSCFRTFLSCDTHPKKKLKRSTGLFWLTVSGSLTVVLCWGTTILLISQHPGERKPSRKVPGQGASPVTHPPAGSTFLDVWITFQNRTTGCRQTLCTCTREGRFIHKPWQEPLGLLLLVIIMASWSNLFGAHRFVSLKFLGLCLVEWSEMVAEPALL